MRLIDADALKERITETDSWLMYNEWGSKTLFHEFIDNAPTIEPSGDEYVPNKSCFACMERANGMCKGTTQEQSWCPHVARNNTEPSKSADQNRADVPSDLVSRAEVHRVLSLLSTEGGKDAKVLIMDAHEFIDELPSAETTGALDDAIAKYVADGLMKLPSAEPKGANLINRHDATTVIREECLKCNNLTNADLLGRILALPTSRQTDCTEFIEWLVDRVLDETIWENNSVAYGEIICRKLEKLGVLEVTEEPSYYIRPSADAVHGEWIKKQVFNPEIDKYVPLIECSVCGYEPYFGGSESKFNYCANCGAIMKGGAE